jgi:hypothetical protein
MKKHPCLISEQTTYVLMRDYGSLSSVGYVILFISKNDTFTKVDTRLKGDEKMCIATFVKLYSHGCLKGLEQKTLKEILI